MEFEIVKFPLEDDWVAYHTPADKIPTHGTDAIGCRYAYDILKINWKEKGLKFYKDNTLSYWLKGVKLKNCLGYGETLFAPFSGTVIETHSEYHERGWLHPIIDNFLTYSKSLNLIFGTTLKKNLDLVPFIGNYIIMKMPNKEIYAMFAHLKKNSLKVVVGELIEINQSIAQVGHSGNSTAPHLHFQLMDRVNLLDAQGIPCAFEKYETYKNRNWEVIRNGTPEKLIPIRSCT